MHILTLVCAAVLPVLTSFTLQGCVSRDLSALRRLRSATHAHAPPTIVACDGLLDGASCSFVVNTGLLLGRNASGTCQKNTCVQPECAKPGQDCVFVLDGDSFSGHCQNGYCHAVARHQFYDAANTNVDWKPSTVTACEGRPVGASCTFDVTSGLLSGKAMNGTCDANTCVMPECAEAGQQCALVLDGFIFQGGCQSGYCHATEQRLASDLTVDNVTR
eukprot:TRINITY_DN20077_c0_g1_i1.p1 TRINITY_DN20077_c0_g1~~TRINITY_DN20077_c0_g1_i1.p1  ORF type:complete len:218 (-),score=21.07 TRINITY_DN20077_c0_g1_i1:437-1090(-)